MADLQAHLALCLLEQVLQVVHVMAADEDCLALHWGDANLSGGRVAIPAGQQ